MLALEVPDSGRSSGWWEQHSAFAVSIRYCNSWNDLSINPAPLSLHQQQFRWSSITSVIVLACHEVSQLNATLE